MSSARPTHQAMNEPANIQKGTTKRLVRFLAPGDIKGMGMLVESADTMYALLPAFGNRVRRLGTHQVSQSFMGSDLASPRGEPGSDALCYSSGMKGEISIEPGYAGLCTNCRHARRAQSNRGSVFVRLIV